jgi:hypothetical protein
LIIDEVVEAELVWQAVASLE